MGKAYEISSCYCPKCKNVFPIPRMQGRKRENGHIKHIYCPFCREMHGFKETKDNIRTLSGEWTMAM